MWEEGGEKEVNYWSNSLLMASSRQLAAIMFTDIVGYTSLMGEDEGKAFAILSKNRRLERPLIEQYNGKWIKEIGDGILASFSTVTDAVLCAVAIQKGCRENGDFQLRIGIHQSEVVFEDGDVFGDGVNIASRVQALAPIGGIWITEPVYQNIANKKEVYARSVREEVLKNVKEPVRIYEIVLDGELSASPSKPPGQGKGVAQPYADGVAKRRLFLAGVVVLLATVLGFVYWMNHRPNGKQIRSIAVLPFVNETNNKDLEYLSDGMTETLIRSLSQLPGLNVKARSSVFRYKGKEPDAQAVGKDLHVQAVLNGRVVQRGEVWTLYLELVDAANNNQIWGEQYDRKAADLVSLQSEIARDVSDKLRVELSGDEERQLAKKYTASPEAYQLYLKGRFHWNKRTPEGVQKAIQYFNQAIALDPNYALAYAGLADAYAVIFDYERGYQLDNIDKGREAAMKALALDHGLAEAHASLGLILLNSYDLAGAERELKQALQLNPNYASAHQWYGNLLLATGKIEEALVEYRRALEIEPLSVLMNNVLASGLFFARKYDESIAQSQKTLEIDPAYAAAHGNLAFCYVMKDDYTKAVEHFAKSRELSGDAGAAKRMREFFAQGGWQGYLRSQLKDPRVLATPYTLARIHLRLSNKDEAIAQLYKSFERREPQLLRIKVDPRLDGLDADPRFQELVRRMGIE
jgi:adenylate cyclase